MGGLHGIGRPFDDEEADDQRRDGDHEGPRGQLTPSCFVLRLWRDCYPAISVTVTTRRRLRMSAAAINSTPVNTPLFGQREGRMCSGSEDRVFYRSPRTVSRASSIPQSSSAVT